MTWISLLSLSRSIDLSRLAGSLFFPEILNTLAKVVVTWAAPTAAELLLLLLTMLILFLILFVARVSVVAVHHLHPVHTERLCLGSLLFGQLGLFQLEPVALLDTSGLCRGGRGLDRKSGRRPNYHGLAGLLVVIC